MAEETSVNTQTTTPATETTTQTTAVETPVVTNTASAVETPTTTNTETPAETVTETPTTVLAEALDKKPVEQTTTKTETQPAAEAPKEGEATTDNKEQSEGQSAEPASPPVYDEFKLPEGFTLDKERVTKFNEILGDLELKSKADHALVQEFGQKAVDFHISEVKKAVDDLTKYYQTAWDRQKTEWKDQFLKDPEMGGNRFQTTVDSALNFIRTHGGTAEQQTEFRNLMESSGLGNHPAVIRLLANAGRAMAEGKPLAATKPVPQAKSKVATLYGGKP